MLYEIIILCEIIMLCDRLTLSLTVAIYPSNILGLSPYLIYPLITT